MSNLVSPLNGCSCNRFEMFNAMVNRTPITLGGIVCLINGIEIEDGSGYNFNVNVLVNNTTHNIYVKG